MAFDIFLLLYSCTIVIIDDMYINIRTQLSSDIDKWPN